MAAAPGKRVRVHALRAGTWPAHPADVTLTESDLAATAAAYDPARYKAPCVIGHPKQDDPAWGWVEGASTAGDGLWLEASLTPELAELIQEKRYQNVSVSLWRPDATGNPSPGSWSLRHLGFLGAVPPACKGLAAVALAADDASALVSLGVFSVELSDIPLDPPSRGGLENQTGKDGHVEKEKELEQQAVELAEREATLATREATLAKRERELRLASIGAEIDGHITAGRVLPAEKPALVALMEMADGQTVDLSDAEKDLPAGQVLRSFLKTLPARVDLSERSAPDGTDAASVPRAPDGYTLSERGAALHRRALAIQASQKCDYVTAVRQAESEA